MCNGQLLPINQNTALFSLLGTFYGGNGTTTFALPNFQGRVAMSQGNGFNVGQTGGSESATITR
jgi:microcystin-dependent protein